MPRYARQAAMDFFFDFDNQTNPPWPVPGTQTPTDPPPPDPATLAAENVVFPLALSFYKLSPSQFKQAANRVRAKQALEVVWGLTTRLVVKHFGGFGTNLQRGFEDFAQGVLFDPRRNTEAYGYWSVHSMDAIYPAEASEFPPTQPFPPNGYYVWYGCVRAASLVPGAAPRSSLSFARDLALAAAIQNVAQPRRIVGPSAFNKHNQPSVPYANPKNRPIPRGELNAFRQRYLGLSFTELDEAFKTTDGGRLGPH